MKSLSIVAYVHLYLPTHNAGAEVMLHEILLELIKLGHKATVICGEMSVSELYPNRGKATKLSVKAIKELLDNYGTI